MKLKKIWTAGEIARMLNAKLIGDEKVTVSGINEIHKVEQNDLTFADHEKYYGKALKSVANILILDRVMLCPEGKALIIHNDPFMAYNQLIEQVVEQKHPFSEPPSLGEHTWIHPSVVFGNNIKIGNNCKIYPNVVLYDNTIIRNDVIIHANSVIGADALYFRKNEQLEYDKLISCGRVIIEDKVEIGACCTIDKGVSGDTIIGRGTKLDNHIHVGHGTTIGENCLLAAQVGIGGKVTIQDNVLIWGQVGINKGVTIGENAVILAQSGIAKSLKGNKAYFGSPAAEAKKMFKELMTLRQLPEIIVQLRDSERNIKLGRT